MYSITIACEEEMVKNFALHQCLLEAVHVRQSLQSLPDGIYIIAHAFVCIQMSEWWVQYIYS